MVDIVDEIDALVDGQIAGGEPEAGYDYDDPGFPRCWHCWRRWHGLAVTEHIALMCAEGREDEIYCVAVDDTPVVCWGSDFIGPMPEEGSYSGVPRVVRRIRETVSYWSGKTGRQPALSDSARWWRLPYPSPDAVVQYIEGMSTDTLSWTDGDQFESWPLQHVRCVIDTWPAERVVHDVAIDILADTMPRIGGRWEPLTTPGSTQHPDEIDTGGDKLWVCHICWSVLGCDNCDCG